MPGIEEDRLRAYLGLSEQVNGLGNGGRAGMADALRDAVRMFRGLHLEYALFGAFAVAAYVPERRSTLDIDFVTRADAGAALAQAAPDFGFEVDPNHREAPILRFRHRSGTILDILCDPLGFADLDKIRQIDLPGVGIISLADPLDVAYSKLRTQAATAQRDPQKRLIDRSDLVAMLREHPGLERELRARIPSVRATGLKRSERGETLAQILQAVCRDAWPESRRAKEPSSRFPRAMLVMAALLAVALAAWWALRLISH